MPKVFVRIALVLSFMASATAASGAAANEQLPPVRHRNVMLTMPEGWSRDIHEETKLVLTPGDVAFPHRVVVQVGDWDQSPKGVRGHLDSTLETLKTDGFKNIALDGEVTPLKHPAGYDTLTVVVSADTAGASLWVQFVEMDGGDGSSQSFALIATSRKAFDQYRTQFEDLVRGVRLPSRMKLAEAPASAGVKPLTYFTACEVIDFVEWMLEVPFTRQQRDACQAYLVEVWTKGDQQEIEDIQEVHKARAEQLIAQWSQIAPVKQTAEQLKQDRQTEARKLAAGYSDYRTMWIRDNAYRVAARTSVRW